MLDIKFIREHPKEVKASVKKRGMDEIQVDKLLELDERWKTLKKETEELRAERNKISESINAAKKQGKKVDDIIKKAKEIPEKIAEGEKELVEIAAKRKEIFENLPNIVDKSVPVGDASKNKIVQVVGKPKKLSFKPRGHEELMELNDLVDVERASKVAGARFYYLKRELVKLNQALINFALDFLAKKGFVLMQPPYMLRGDVLKGAIVFAAFEEMIYKIDGEDLYMIGTAEHALNAYHMNEIIDVAKPMRYAGFSSCFRKEAGAHGKDTKGIFRIHQFEKVEQFIFCKPEESWKEFDLILKNSVDMFKLLGIPFRVVNLSSEEIGRVATKTMDLEGWFPAQKCYRELGSCSNCLDYQARRSNIKFQDKGELKFANTLNNTAIATERMLCCIVENYQQKDGSIKIPKVLQKYTGFKEIKIKKK
jgi:seryl-tRNA synthetase